MQTADTPLTNARHDHPVVPVHFLLLDLSNPARLCLYLAVKMRDQLLPPYITAGKVINLYSVQSRFSESRFLEVLFCPSQCFKEFFATNEREGLGFFTL